MDKQEKQQLEKAEADMRAYATAIISQWKLMNTIDPLAASNALMGVMEYLEEQTA